MKKKKNENDNVGDRIKWKNLVGGKVIKKIKSLLFNNKLKLNITFDSNKQAEDVFISEIK